MAAKVTVVRPRRTLRQRFYLWEVVRGLGVTFRSLFVNLLTKREVSTIRYPEERARYPKRFRGLHRLMAREDGRVRCVACMMCSTACPARCIYIVPAETDDPKVEKYPASFEIDELLCVDCGLCVEACPCDAIRMDTGLHPPPATRRDAFLLGKADLLELAARSAAVQGGASPGWRAGPEDPRSPEEFRDGHGHGGSGRGLPGARAA